MLESFSARAGITQLVECQLPKLDVAGSNPVARSIFVHSRRGRHDMGIFGRDDQSSDNQTPIAERPSHGAASHTEVVNRTAIARQARLEGRLSGASEIIVDGSVKGTIDGGGRVRIAEQGRVEATVHGRIVSIAGTVTGDITADERIELDPSARVEGNITAPRILIKDGAIFKGQVNMKVPEHRPPLKTSSARKGPGEPSGT
jgi:cytoskeletal protein CcmA (bactofilin family)